MHLKKVWRCPLIDNDIATEGCSCFIPCDHAYVVHILYKKVDGKWVEWEDIPTAILVDEDVPEKGWKLNRPGPQKHQGGDDVRRKEPR